MLLHLGSSSGDSHLHELLFQLSQPILGRLGGRPVHNHASDVSLLVGDVAPEVGYLPIHCGAATGGVRLIHEEKLFADA